MLKGGKVMENNALRLYGEDGVVRESQSRRGNEGFLIEFTENMKMR